MRAIVVTGGKGRRLRPFSNNIPKHLLPVGQLSILAHLLMQLDTDDIEVIEVVIGWKGDLILSEIENINLSTPIKIVHDAKCPGSWWPVIYQHIKNLPHDEPILILQGDLFVTLDIESMIRECGYYLDKFISFAFPANYPNMRRGVFMNANNRRFAVWYEEKNDKIKGLD